MNWQLWKHEPECNADKLSMIITDMIKTDIIKHWPIFEDDSVFRKKFISMNINNNMDVDEDK